MSPDQEQKNGVHTHTNGEAHTHRDGVLATWIRQLPTAEGSDLDGIGTPAEGGALAEASQGDDVEDLDTGSAEALSS